jgi:hypothetical protein
VGVFGGTRVAAGRLAPRPHHAHMRIGITGTPRPPPLAPVVIAAGNRGMRTAAATLARRFRCAARPMAAPAAVAVPAAAASGVADHKYAALFNVQAEAYAR